MIGVFGCAREPAPHRPSADAEPTPPVESPAIERPTATRPLARLAPIAPAKALVLLSPEDHLVRIALVLRGARPRPEELEAVRRDPAAIEAIVDRYLDEPTFGEVVRDLWNEVLLLRVEAPRYNLPAVGPLAEYAESPEALRTIAEEPLRLIEYVAVHDRPFSEVVTADYSLATEVGIAAWGATTLPAEAGARLPEGWQRVRWDSEQPMAGILSSGALWLRHPSNGANNHRGQAEVIAESFLCSGFLDRDVPLFNNIDLSDEEVVKSALTREPGCVSCHQTLDPLASHLFGFVRVAPGAIRKAHDRDGECSKPGRPVCYPLAEYDPKRAGSYRKKTGRAPNFFGLPSRDLTTLGAQIADDPRFSMCVARRFYGYFMQVEPEAIPDATAASLQDALLGADLRVKDLVKAIVLADDFRAIGGPGPIEALVGRKTTRPEQLSRLVADITGFTWTLTPANKKFGVIDLLATDRLGYRAIAGGVEGTQVNEPSYAYSPTRSLVLQALAAEAAAFAVKRDLAAPAGRRELLTIDGAARGDDEVRAQIVALYQRVLAESIDPRGAEADAALALLRPALDRDPGRAWTLLLAALLQDPRIAFH
ncbi:MAG: hypothetical protein R3B09_18875 [Nannocystaceae bacterium]